MPGGWTDLFRALGESLLQVFKAELAAIEEDFRRTGVHLKASLGLLGVALVLLFWVTGLVIFSLVAILAIWLPVWGAALIVL
ncbi:MAG TPA: phage holin family protein, partial [Thermoanaerobaculia bacterium]|nr:phage holin family protein [Thermoanaerobaculia bacterium]